MARSSRAEVGHASSLGVTSREPARHRRPRRAGRARGRPARRPPTWRRWPARLTECRACPRLVAWREQVAVREAGARSPTRPTGDGRCPASATRGARLLVVGLAPAAHGANRTGRMFTGDRSGDWLYAALHRAGLATSPTAVSARRRAAAARGVHHRRGALRAAGQQAHHRRAGHLPPVAEPRARPAAGRGWTPWWCSAGSAGRRCGRRCARRGSRCRGPSPPFGHGARCVTVAGRSVLGCYHVSQQNTFTGRLTEAMLDAVLGRAAELAGLPDRGAAHAPLPGGRGPR